MIIVLQHGLYFSIFWLLASSHNLLTKYTKDTPCTCLWTRLKGASDVVSFRTVLDMLQKKYVCWMPYVDHKQHYLF